MATDLAQKEYAAFPVLVYPMLHLVGDTNERGRWHRDGAERDRRVFWLPLTDYNYSGLSVIPWSSGILSKPFAHLKPDWLATDLTIKDNSYYSWSPRMVHRGNLNTSDDLSSAIVMFLDKKAQPSGTKLSKLTTTDIVKYTRTVKMAIKLDDTGNIVSIDNGKLNDELPTEFKSHFFGFFKLRTGIEL